MARSAIVELVQQPRRENAGAPKLTLCCVGGGEIEPTALIQQAVARQVYDHKVADATAGQEYVNLPSDLPLILVDDPGNGEGADARVAEDLGQVICVMSRRAELAKIRILVAGGGDDQGCPRLFRRFRNQSDVGRASHR